MVKITNILPVGSKTRKVRARVAGIIVLVMAFGLIFFFGFNEPTAIAINDETDVIICPPICDEPFFEIPIPTFEGDTIEMTPIITVVDDTGFESSVRGETTILQSFLGLNIAEITVGERVYSNGKLFIDLELNANTGDELQVEKQIRVTGTLQSVETNLSDLDVPENSVDVSFSVLGGTTAGIQVTRILDTRIDALVPDETGTFSYNFLLLDLTLEVEPLRDPNIAIDTSIGATFPTPSLFTLPTTVVQCITAPCPPLTNPVLLGTATFESRLPEMILAPPDDSIIIIPVTDPIPIVEVIEEDTPFLPCPSVETDSISILFPSLGVSLTTALWDKIIIDGKSHDIINVDIRNNRNCDITLAVGSQWQRVTGQIFKSEIEEFTVVTNGTKPFSSIPFDGTIDCNAGSCGGLEIQWCFIAKATVDDVTEIVDPFCGKKFYR
jgi:hypothetical protein